MSDHSSLGFRSGRGGDARSARAGKGRRLRSSVKRSVGTALLAIAAPFSAHAGTRRKSASNGAKRGMIAQSKAGSALRPWRKFDCGAQLGTATKIATGTGAKGSSPLGATPVNRSASLGEWCGGTGQTEGLLRWPNFPAWPAGWNGEAPARPKDDEADGFGNELASGLGREFRRPDFNRNIFYADRLEFSWEVGLLPFNIPFPFEFLLGDQYDMTPLHYTLLPQMGLLRWQFDNVGGPSFLRGNWEATFGGSFTGIVRGPESRWGGYVMGIRRNFVQRNWRIVPYLDGNVGTGGTDAKEPAGVVFAQGQDFTFTLMLGAGVRYDFDSRYALEVGMKYMHISNLYLSEPKYPNYGINVYGPMIGLDIRLGGPRRGSEE